MFSDIREKHEPVSIGELAVSGKDIISAGMQPGPQVGQMLRDLLELVIEEPEKNNRKLLLTEIEKRIKIEGEN